MNIEEILKKYWGYENFRTQQKEIIESILSGKDTLALLPTGGGKSICYQIPALYREGIAIVVSPLIALMKDQTEQLAKRGIKARCIVSGMSRNQVETILNQCIHNGVKLLYISPERLKSQLFIEHLRQMNVNLIAIDEAHCISQWGYDFRPSYLDVVQLRQYHPQVPIIALTATATTEVVEDICLRLEFRGRNIYRSSYYRANLSYHVVQYENKQERLLQIVKRLKGSGIIYVRNRRRTQEISRLLEGSGYPAMAYHAGMGQQERDTKQRTWQESDRSIMVATNAFGMGIDKPDVRYVIHMDIPNSPEAYFQEAGRAGRDGERAYAILLYNDGDMDLLKHGIEQGYPPIKYIKNVYRGICNYYQIPIGAGMDSRFDFEAEEICKTYGFEMYTFFTATQFLTREGVIALPERNALESKLMITSTKEDLYRFQVENRRWGDLVTVILRLYGGLFSEYTPISETQIARRYGCKENVVTDVLMQMHKMGLVDYQRKTTHPQIVFSTPRMNIEDLRIGDHNYKELKERAIQRVEAMIKYVNEKSKCRSQQLSSYFGEENSPECGSCDVCRKRNEGTKNQDETNIRQEIISTLEKRSMTVKELSSVLSHINAEELSREVRGLLDKGKLKMDDWVLSVCRKNI